MLKQLPVLAVNVPPQWINSKVGYRQQFNVSQVISTRMHPSDYNQVLLIILLHQMATLTAPPEVQEGEAVVRVIVIETETLSGHLKMAH